MPEILSIGELLDLGNSAATAGLIPYSALEYNGSGDISGISGSAIAGGVDSAVVSSIVSSYVESGISGKADKTALEECCSAMSSVVSGKADVSALEECCSAMSSVVSAKMDKSESSSFYPMTGNPSGFLTTTDLSDYATTAYVDSSVSSKMDKSESSSFYSTANESGFITSADAGTSFVYNSAYSSFSGDTVNNISSLSSIVSAISSETGNIPFSALEYDADSAITAISGSSIGGQGGIEYTGISPINVNNTDHEISVSSTPLAVETATMREYDQGGIHYFGVKSGVFAETGDLTGYVPVSSISAESSQWNNISSLSSYALSSSLTAYALSSSLTAYVPKSSISARSGTWNTVSGKIPYSALEYDADSAITAISGSAIGADITKVIAYSALEYDADSAITAISGSAIGSDTSNAIPYSALEYNGDKISGISGSAIEADSWHVTASSISSNYKRADIDGLQVFYTPKTVTGVTGAQSSTGETASAVGVTVQVNSGPSYGAGLFTVPDISTAFAPIPAECYRSASGMREWTITGLMNSAHRILYATEVGRTDPYNTGSYSARDVFASEELTSDDPYTIISPWSASSIIVWESGNYAISPPYGISASSTVSVDYVNVKKYSNDSAVVVPDLGNISTALLSADPTYFAVDNKSVGGSAVNVLTVAGTATLLGYLSTQTSANRMITITASQSSLAFDNILTNLNASKRLDINLLISSPYSSFWALVQVDDTYNHKTLAFCSVPSGDSATVQMHANTYDRFSWGHPINEYANKDTYIEVYGVPTGTVITAHSAIIQVTDGPRRMTYFTA